VGKKKTASAEREFLGKRSGFMGIADWGERRKKKKRGLVDWGIPKNMGFHDTPPETLPTMKKGKKYT